MKKPYPLLLLFFFITVTSFAQVVDTTVTETEEKPVTAIINFEKGKDTLRKKDMDVAYPITIKIASVEIEKSLRNLYTVTVTAADASTLPSSDYTLHYNSFTLDKVDENPVHTLFITVNKDTENDRIRQLLLSIAVQKDGKEVGVNIAKEKTQLELTIEPARAIDKYNYLAYIGTNFDLIDGVRAKDIFFATSIFAPPGKRGDGFGFNLTLYGNRTVTLSNNNPQRKEYTSRIEPIGGDTVRIIKEEGLRTISRVSDNLGASFSPLIRLWDKTSDPDRATKIYYAPQLEFIYRRTKITTEYTDIIAKDTIIVPDRPISTTQIITPQTETIPFTVYDVYLGPLGLFLNHENKYISVRLQGSMGINFSYTAKNKDAVVVKQEYDREYNYFCFLRTWITEPTTGLTFGAEVSNNFITSNSQPYYNVTLSKAINLSALSKIFQPLTSSATTTAE